MPSSHVSLFQNFPPQAHEGLHVAQDSPSRFPPPQESGQFRFHCWLSVRALALYRPAKYRTCAKKLHGDEVSVPARSSTGIRDANKNQQLCPLSPLFSFCVGSAGVCQPCASRAKRCVHVFSTFSFAAAHLSQHVPFGKMIAEALRSSSTLLWEKHFFLQKTQKASAKLVEIPLDHETENLFSFILPHNIHFCLKQKNRCASSHTRDDSTAPNLVYIKV